MASTDQEGFSFPIITETHPPSIDSPPLWHDLSPPAASSPNHNKLPKEENYKQMKSCSNLETEDEDEEKGNMDILWEDYFNEEVSKLEANKRVNDIINSSAAGELGCVQALKLSKNGNVSIFSAAKKPPSIVVFIKVLKKLFLLHNTSHHNHRSVKNNKAC